MTCRATGTGPADARRPATGHRGSAPVVARSARPGEPTRPVTWQLAEEVAVAIELNSHPIAVMMASPVDLEEMAIGFLISERQAPRDRITAAIALPAGDGFCVDVAAPGIVPAPRERGLEGRSGCGLCGMRALTDVALDLPRGRGGTLDPAAVVRAFDELTTRQPMRAVNASVHAAGFATPDGVVALVREDVGRHTALDKLIGALAVRGIDPAGGFALLTSRCSFELVQKAAICGFSGLATRSAPTRLAVETAAGARLPLACLAGEAVVGF